MSKIMNARDIGRSAQSRKKIWELVDCHCPIVGTCLSLKDLEKIVRKTGLVLPQGAGEFEIHNIVVRLCMEPGPVSRTVNRLLDRKFQNAVRRFSKATDEPSLGRLWADSLARGDIPGPFWAVMTHPHAGVKLQMKAFGDVHMLSHLVGRSNRADIRKLAQLQAERDKTEVRHARMQVAYRKRVTGLIEENRRLREELQLVRMGREAAPQPSSGYQDELRAVRTEFLKREEALESRARTEMERAERAMSELEDAVARLECQLADKGSECRALEFELERLLETAGAVECADRGTDRCPGPDLCGKRILYVGGRTGLVRHYRGVVERYGGEFLHHDGGMEDGSDRLCGLLQGADAVLCPVDCVSHDACKRVKSACRNCMKPLVMLRSSGLSSLARTLGDMSQESRTQ